jgi:hypothetical protein
VILTCTITAWRIFRASNEGWTLESLTNEKEEIYALVSIIRIGVKFKESNRKLTLLSVTTKGTEIFEN